MPPGVVSDFADLAPVQDYLRTGLDLRVLPEALGRAPTLEHLARHLFGWCMENLPVSTQGHLVEVRISQPPTVWAAYSGDPL